MAKYIGILERAPERWTITLPAFPGTVAAGSSVNDVLTKAEVVLAMAISALQEAGAAAPPPFAGDLADYVYDRSGLHEPIALLISASPHLDVTTLTSGEPRP